MKTGRCEGRGRFEHQREALASGWGERKTKRQIDETKCGAPYRRDKTAPVVTKYKAKIREKKQDAPEDERKK